MTSGLGSIRIEPVRHERTVQQCPGREVVGSTLAANGRRRQLFPDESAGRRGLTHTTLDFSITYEGKQSESSVLGRRPTKSFLPSLTAGDPASDNRYYFGENDDALRSLLDDPTVRRQVRLVYIDPPYGTEQNFRGRHTESAYDDSLAGAKYLEFIRERLILMRELLADDGSIYVHLDNAMIAPIKVIMDELFGPGNFRNWITRKKCNPKNFTNRQYGNVQDYILFYSRGKNPVWNRPFEEERIYTVEQRFPRLDEATGRHYALVPLHAKGRRNGATGGAWRGLLPPEGKHWQYHPDKLDKLDHDGHIYWSPTGNPRRKIYADESHGVPVQDMWTEFKDAHNQNVKITGYPTEKNIDLLKRIVSTSSNPDDLVLDCFAGSGTTIVAADDLERRWIGMDKGPLARLVTLERLLDPQAIADLQLDVPRMVGLFDDQPNVPARRSFTLCAKEPWFESLEDQGPVVMARLDRGLSLSISQPQGSLQPLGLLLADYSGGRETFRVDAAVHLGGNNEIRVTLPLPHHLSDSSGMASLLIFATDGTAWRHRVSI